VEFVFSLKTNFLPALLAELRGLGFGVDVVSDYELVMALRAGFTGPEIIVNGPAKSPELLRRAVDLGCFVNVDTVEELHALASVAEDVGEVLPVGLRLSSPIDPYTGRERVVPSKFGAPVGSPYTAELLEFLDQSPCLKLSGLQAHLGSQMVDQDHVIAALDPILELAGQLRRHHDLDRVNLGGGIGVSGISRQAAGPADPSRPQRGGADFRFVRPDLTSWFAALDERWDQHGLRGLRMVLEPGRAVASRCMELLMRVTTVRRDGVACSVGVDGGVNLMPTAGPAEAHRIRFPGRAGLPVDSVIGGPLCYEGDLWSFAAPVPEDVGLGDMVVVADAGAYSLTRASSFNQTRAPVIQVGPGESSALVWRRETVDDVLAFAVPTP
jgi:diaminopimelate decarboxylase